MKRGYLYGNTRDIVLWIVFLAILLLYIWALLTADARDAVPERQIAPVQASEPPPRPGGPPERTMV